MTRPRCYLDIEIDNEPAGRVVIELFNDLCPITCENFRALCTGEKGLGKVTKKPLWYKNTIFHRIVKNFVIQSGDFETGNGTGGESIYGGQFDDEGSTMKHDRPLLLSMANKGPDTNGSQFFITLQKSPHLDKLHTVFGHVISGEKIIRKIENLKTDQNSKPIKEVKIAQCGELVLQSEQRRTTEQSTSESSSSSSSSEEEKRKKKKKKKKERNTKKEKKSRGFYSSSNKAEDDIVCNVDPEEIPSIPDNVFLMRRTSPLMEFRRTPRGRDNYQFKRGPPSRTRSGRKVKGRGNMRYRTPSSSDERSGSETPPHWKQAQCRLKKLKEVIKDKDKNKNSDSELSNTNEEENENKSQHNPFLQSRLGSVSARNFEDERRREKDARMNINENRQRRAYSQESSRYDQDNEQESLFDRLMQEDQRHGKAWFDENNKEESDEEHSSPVRSKIVVKSSVSRRNSRDNRKDDEREKYRRYDESRRRRDSSSDRRYENSRRRDSPTDRRYDENSRRRDSPSDRRYDENSRRRDSPPNKRSRTSHPDSSSGHDNAYKKASHSENKKETNNANDKKNDESKPLSGTTKKRLNLLENDLLRYNKQIAIVPQPKKGKLKRDRRNRKKNLINDAHNDNLAALKENETKSNENSGNTQAESSIPVLKKIETGESSPHTSHEIQQSDSSLLLKEKVSENNLSIATFSPDINITVNSSTPVVSEEIDKAFDCDKKKEKLTIEEYTEKNEQKFKSVEKTGEKDCEFAEVIPLPDEKKDDSKNTENIFLRRINEVQMPVADKKEMEFQNMDVNVQVAKSLSVGSPESGRMSKSPPRSRSPLHHKTIKRISKSPDNQKASSSKQSHSPHSRRSKSPLNRAKSPISQRRKLHTRRSKSRSRSRSAQRIPSRTQQIHRKYSRSPDTRLRHSRSRSRSHSRSRNVSKGNRFYRHSGVRHRSPEFRDSFQRQNKSPPYRGRARGRSTTRRSITRSRSHSIDKKRRHRRQVSSSSSSSSSSRSDSVKRRNKKNSNAKGRNKRSSSSSSSASSRSKRSNS